MPERGQTTDCGGRWNPTLWITENRELYSNSRPDFIIHVLTVYRCGRVLVPPRADRAGEAVPCTGGGGFELRGREHAQGAGVAADEMLLDSLLVGWWKFAVDERANVVRIEMLD
jgi:hypothetical protein